MKRDYNFYIKDILKSIHQIESFVEGLQYEEFRKDDKTASAVIRKLEIIGEAAKQIPTRIRQTHPELPWTEMARMRDKLIHGYFGVDHEIIWKVVKERLPEVKATLEKIIAQLD
ncbi:MAG TPA: DUF86 domain-containing protein [Syntrophales bacterium]|nr:DUF86 domain-containing protein [Syntrophales bacterium]